MNPTLSVLENRRSVRNYSANPLAEDEKEAIVHAAMRAPTAGNLMLYTILEIEDQTIKDQLAVSVITSRLLPKPPTCCFLPPIISASTTITSTATWKPYARSATSLPPASGRRYVPGLL